MKGLLAHQALRDLQGREVQPEPLGPLEFQGDLGPRDLQGQQERKGLLVRKAPKAQLAETVSRVLWGSRVQLALWVPLEKTEIRERSGSQGRKEAKGTKESRVLPGLQVLKAPSDSRVPLELTASQGLGASRAFLGRKVMKVPEVSLDPPGQWGCRVCQDLRVRRVRQETWARWAPQVPLAPEDPLELQVLMAHKVPQVE